MTPGRVLSALPRSGGIISCLAARLGVSWHTAKNLVERWPVVRAAYDDEINEMLDHCEMVILSAIRDDNDMDALKWYLENHPRGRVRGYGR